ncbi:MAG: hypothetical protein MRY63_03270 [Neomegalonema sp.]|nr:hypothetical protein [Neomegalonema sp.]
MDTKTETSSTALHAASSTAPARDKAQLAWHTPPLKVGCCGDCSMECLDKSAAAQLRLCDTLEEAADELPSFSARRLGACSSALRLLGEAREIGPVSAAMRQIESAPPALQKLEKVLILIADEATQDADLALELADALDEVIRIGVIFNPDALGYLMRQFFENKRRHLSWRREAFVLPVRDLISDADFSTVMAAIEGFDGAGLPMILHEAHL